jgi:hypothetical protein
MKKKKIDNEVLVFMKGRVAVDLKTLVNGIGIDIGKIIESIRRLISKKELPDNFKYLKSEMEAFEVGDFVRILDSKFGSLVGKLHYSNNIFEIEEITKDNENLLKYKLYGIDDYLSEDFIEAIPIDGVHDIDIYYVPIVAGSFNPSSKPQSSIRSYKTYYMDSFKNDKFHDKTLDELLKDANCRFVHEVQHYLDNKFKQKHELKIHHIQKVDLGLSSEGQS